MTNKSKGMDICYSEASASGVWMTGLQGGIHGGF